MACDTGFIALAAPDDPHGAELLVTDVEAGATSINPDEWDSIMLASSLEMEEDLPFWVLRAAVRYANLLLDAARTGRHIRLNFANRRTYTETFEGGMFRRDPEAKGEGGGD